MDNESVISSKKATVMTWAQVEAQIDQIRNKRTDFLDRDDALGDFGCGEWYFDAKEDVSKDVFIPAQLVPLYSALLGFVYICVTFWVILVFFIPIFGMHGIERYVTQDLRYQYIFYWIFQPIYFFSYVFTMGKITLDRTRQSIIIGIVNFTWHIIHICMAYSLPASRQDTFKIIHTILLFMEIFFNLVLILLTVFLSVKLNALIQMIQQSKTQVKPELLNMNIKQDDSGMAIVYNENENEDEVRGNQTNNKNNNSFLNQTKPQHKIDNSIDKSNLEDDDQVPDQAIKSNNKFYPDHNNKFLFNQYEESPFDKNSHAQNDNSAFKERLAPPKEEGNEYQKMKSLLKTNDKRKKWGKNTDKTYDDVQDLELKKIQKDITQLLEQ